MEELFNQFNLISQEDFSFFTYVINILICTLLLYILSVIYIKYGKSISNRSQLSKVFILVGITTFVIISIVKSSLALSLGLVGALSIIRFRTAIKEPEELSYFFISICLGLGLGANQLLPTLIGFIILIVVIIVLNKNIVRDSITQNLLITLDGLEANTENTNKITEIISSNANQVDLKRVKYSESNISLNFLINVSSIKDISTINDTLSELYDKVNLTFIDNEI